MSILRELSAVDFSNGCRNFLVIKNKNNEKIGVVKSSLQALLVIIFFYQPISCHGLAYAYTKSIFKPYHFQTNSYTK